MINRGYKDPGRHPHNLSLADSRVVTFTTLNQSSSPASLLRNVIKLCKLGRLDFRGNKKGFHIHLQMPYLKVGTTGIHVVKLSSIVVHPGKENCNTERSANIISIKMTKWKIWFSAPWHNPSVVIRVSKLDGKVWNCLSHTLHLSNEMLSKDVLCWNFQQST